ncbi:putative ABC transporter ATP-binding protein [bioreactor metagenome]|uniref:Putative ABC transporter ATP-binding protein n=1 Tax=bioreactor metagenome TaxID=1076179 RepID=A0A645ALD2_9ZZZZ
MNKEEGFIKRLFPYLKGYRLPAAFSILCVSVESIMELMIPLVMANIVDVGIKNSYVSYIVNSGLQMVGFALISLATGISASYFASKASRGFGANLRKAEFDKVQDLSFANIDHFSTSSLITRLTNDVTRMERMMLMSIRMMIRSPMMFVSALLLAVYINSDLAMVFLFSIPVLVILVGLTIKKVTPLFGKLQKTIDKLNNVVQENLTAIRVVKSFVRHDYGIAKFDDVNQELKSVSMDVFDKVIIMMPVMQLIVQGTTIAVLWFGALMVGSGTFEIGKLSSFVSYILQILMSVMMMSMVLINITQSIASGKRIIEVLNVEIDITDEKADKELKVVNGDIKFEHVSFKYDVKAEKNVLEDINLDLRSGQMIGLIGGTGSAKSTLVQLIPRLYETTSGRVLVAGHDVRDYGLDELRDNVAMVLQNNTLFSGTIKDNLRWGHEEATDEELTAAAKAASAHDFIMEFPQGYDTNLGQGGVNLSGGQKQRLCIARAILKNPKVLILDDSTSAVDTKTESGIRETLKIGLKDTTKIIIAQRITSVMEADQIIILDDGKINAVGDHLSLLKSNKIYQEIYYSQKEGADFDE